MPIAICAAVLAIAGLGSASGQPPEEVRPRVEGPDVVLQPPDFGRGEDFDSMPKLLAQMRALVADAASPAALAKAAQRLWQVHHMSGLVVLPTPGVEETADMLRMHVRELQTSAEVLDAAARRADLPPEAFDAVLEVKTSLEAEIDSVQTLGKWTATAPPGSKRARTLLKKQIRAPFIPLPFPISQPHEVVTSDVIGVNECMVVVKEIQGMKVRLVLKVLPVWVEPWFARRKIVGFKRVWILEYVPAQFIKRVITCNDCCNRIRPQILTEIVEHPELLDFWRYFKKGHYYKKH
ncbi:MAG: hypothetical protein D6696_20670 [Acidobacteria bacterium]|nr:MAG: hypothetical protein D6696_20670 [Acidobacteriota bacterium]